MPVITWNTQLILLWSFKNELCLAVHFGKGLLSGDQVWVMNPCLTWVPRL